MRMFLIWKCILFFSRFVPPSTRNDRIRSFVRGRCVSIYGFKNTRIRVGRSLQRQWKSRVKNVNLSCFKIHLLIPTTFNLSNLMLANFLLWVDCSMTVFKFRKKKKETRNKKEIVLWVNVFHWTWKIGIMFTWPSIKNSTKKCAARSGSVKVDQLFAGDGSLWVLIDFMFAVTRLLCQMQVKRLELGANS